MLQGTKIQYDFPTFCMGILKTKPLYKKVLPHRSHPTGGNVINLKGQSFELHDF